MVRSVLAVSEKFWRPRAKMSRRLKTALVLFLLCFPGRVFFSEQQAGPKPPGPSPPHLPSPDIATSRILLNPLFIAHLIIWIILIALFAIALVDVMLKCVFYTCAFGVHCFTSCQPRLKRGIPIMDKIRYNNNISYPVSIAIYWMIIIRFQ